MSDWPAPVGAAEAWTHIDTQVFGAPAASIVYSGIAAAAAPRLRVYLYVVKDGSGGIVNVQFNSDAGGNYDFQRIGASAGVVTGQRAVGQSRIRVTDGGPNANEPALAVLTIEKPVAGEVGRTISSAAVQGAAIILDILAGEWTNTGALINRIDLLLSVGSFAAGTRAVLEGAQ